MTSQIPDSEISEDMSDDEHLADTADEEADPIDEPIQLNYSEALSVEECSAALRKFHSRVISIIGPTGAGKTSLIASIYELCQYRKLKGFDFARTKTFYAFERAIHDSRIACAREEGIMLHTPHSTSPGGVEFYHLGLFDRKEKVLIDLLLADRTGEDYNSAKHDPSAVAFLEIERADSITVLVDGTRLLDPSLRDDHESDTNLVVHSLTEGQRLPRDQVLLVVLTKLDQVSRADETASRRVLTLFDTLVAKLDKLYGSWFSDVISFKISALPSSGSPLPIGHGTDGLLRKWVEPRPISPYEYQNYDLSNVRYFSKFNSGNHQE